MSAPESSPCGLDQLHMAIDSFAYHPQLADATLVMPEVMSPAEAEYIHRCGVGIAWAIFEDGTAVHSTYVIDSTTPEVKALAQIEGLEADGVLHPGSVEAAVQSMMQGQFETEWMRYLPRQTD